MKTKQKGAKIVLSFVCAFAVMSLSVPAQTVAEKDTARVTFAGDVLLHDNVNKSAKTGKNTYDYTKMLGGLNEYSATRDLFAVNLEGVVDAYGDNTRAAGYPRFNFPREILNALNKMHVGLLTNANNHSFDYGAAGIAATITAMENAGFNHTGTRGTADAKDSLYTILDVNGIKIGVAAFASLDNGASTAKTRPLVNMFDGYSTKDVPRLCKIAADMRKGGAEIVVFVLHWGVEYQTLPTKTQQALAKQLTNGGVDVIAGSHPHVTQPAYSDFVDRAGVKRRVLVAYSLGNFFAVQNIGIPGTFHGNLLNFTVRRDKNGAYISESSLSDTTCTGGILKLTKK